MDWVGFRTKAQSFKGIKSNCDLECGMSPSYRAYTEVSSAVHCPYMDTAPAEQAPSRVEGVWGCVRVPAAVGPLLER